MIGRSGDDGLQVILASSAERLFDLPSRCPRPAPGVSWSARRRLGTSTTVRDLRLPELEASSQTIDGAWRLPTVGMDPTPVGVSDDGRTIVLVEDEADAARGPSRFAIIDRTAVAPPRIVELARGVRIRRSVAGWLDPVRRRASRRVRRTGTTRSARWTPRPGSLRAGAVADKNEGDEAMAGWPIAQVAATRRDGLHALPRCGASIHPRAEQRRCLGVVHRPAGDRCRRFRPRPSDWGLTATVDGQLDHGRERDARGRGRDPAVRPRDAPDRHVRAVGVDRRLPRQVRPPGGWRSRAPHRRLTARAP